MTCWNCDAANTPSRMFCAECGTFIAIGSKVFSGGSAATTSVAAAMAGPAALVADAGGAGAGGAGAGDAGTMSLGSYSVAMADYERGSRRRLLLAVVSIVLVAVIGLSAIYAAMTRGGGDPAPEPAAALLLDASPAPTEPIPAEDVEVQPIEEVAAEPESVESEPADEGMAEESSGEDLSLVEAEPVTEAEPGTAEAVSAPIEPEAAAAEPAVEAEPDRPAVPALPADDNAAVWRNGWVCDGELALKDERLRDWAITRVSFLPGAGYERVTLHLDRVGDGSGGAATVTTEAFPTARVRGQFPSVRQPSSGRTTLALQFRGGVKSRLELNGYEPRGTQIVKEFSSYPVGRTASRVLVSTASSGCFKVRVPAFAASPNAQQGQIHIDIKS